jgi:hypothetical protein
VRAEWCVLAIACAGCDEIWSIDRVGPPSDSADAPNTVGCSPADHDEDADMAPDACDRCPGIAGDQADGDNDSVGDACDPSGMTSDKLELFAPFVDTSSWAVLSGTWKPDGESLIYDSVAMPSYGVTLFSGVAPEPPFVVELHFAIASIEPQASVFAVIIDGDTSGRGLTCGVQRYASPMRDAVRVTSADAQLAMDGVIPTLGPGGYRVVVSYARTGLVRCSIVSDDLATSSGTSIMLPTQQAAGTLGFRSLHIGVHVHYIALYKAH